MFAAVVERSANVIKYDLRSGRALKNNRFVTHLSELDEDEIEGLKMHLDLYTDDQLVDFLGLEW